MSEVKVERACVLDPRASTSKVSSSAASARPSRSRAGCYSAETAHFEVIAPHESGARPPFPCTRLPQLVFQSLAFKSVLPDVLFMDATVFDEHRHVCWATSVVVSSWGSPASPHQSPFSEHRFVHVDFDREHDCKGEAVRWFCAAEQGSAHLVVQLEYGETSDVGGPPPLPRAQQRVVAPGATLLGCMVGLEICHSRAVVS
eukprot:SRR837773.5039.p1 GENE.SRR837773.5039~~SRR837773.5039.p1  ORF type:complete len:225 (+),score=19.44 SRR837773.5039:73-675(+)